MLLAGFVLSASLIVSGCESGNLTTTEMIEPGIIIDEPENDTGDNESQSESVSFAAADKALETDASQVARKPVEFFNPPVKPEFVAESIADAAVTSSNSINEPKVPEEEPVATYVASTMPYMIEVDVTNRITTVFGQDENGKHTKVVRQMISSVGKPDKPTLLGTFTIPDTGRIDRLD